MAVRIVALSAIVGTWTYRYFREKLLINSLFCEFQCNNYHAILSNINFLY
jgi:hypothetical protein